MVEQEDTLQLRNVIRALRVVALHLELQDAAAGDLDLGEREPQALHILGEIIGGSIDAHGGGQNELGVLHDSGIGLIVLAIHRLFLLKMLILVVWPFMRRYL